MAQDKTRYREGGKLRSILVTDEMWDAIERCGQKMGGMSRSVVVRQAVAEFLIARGFVSEVIANQES